MYLYAVNSIFERKQSTGFLLRHTFEWKKWRKIGPVKKAKNVHLNRYSQALLNTENNFIWIDLHHPMRTKFHPTLRKEKNSSKPKAPSTVCRKRAI